MATSDAIVKLTVIVEVLEKTVKEGFAELREQQKLDRRAAIDAWKEERAERIVAMTDLAEKVNMNAAWSASLKNIFVFLGWLLGPFIGFLLGRFFG